MSGLRPCRWPPGWRRFIGDAVSVDREVAMGEIDGGGIVELYGIVGLRCTEGDGAANNRMPRQRAFFTFRFLRRICLRAQRLETQPENWAGGGR